MQKNIRLLLFICIVFNTIFSLYAESDGGVWKIHSVLNENRTKVVDAGDKVYCLTDKYLNAYNKSTEEFESLTKLDRLSDYYVSNVYYNKQKNYIVVTYTNYNIDILLDNGTTVNIPNLKNLTTVSDRTINDVNFANGNIYVASKVGYIVIDDTDFNVKKSAFFNSNVQSVTEVGNLLILANGSNTFYADKEENVKSISQMKSSALGVSGTFIPIDDNHFFLNGSLLYLVTIADDGTMSKSAVSSAKVVDVQPSAGGFIAVGGTSVTATTKYYAFDENGTKTVDLTLPTDLKNTLLSSQESDGTLWRLGAKGLKKVSLDTSSSSVTSLTDELTPNCVTTNKPIEIAYNKGNKRTYVTNGGTRSEYIVNKYGLTGLISSYDGTAWKNEVPADLKGYKLQDPYNPIFDPDDVNTFYVGTWYQGMFKIKDGELIAKYDWNNSPMIHALNNWFCQVPTYQFDSKGNLWTIQYTYEEKDNEIFVLPKESLNKTDDLTEADWVVPSVKTKVVKRALFLIDSNDYKVLFEGEYDKDLKIIGNESIENPKYKDFTYFVDQDGRKITCSLILDFEEDKNGIVWVAHTWGLFGMRLNEAFDEDFRVIRPKDNSIGFFVLDNVFVTTIAVDDYNRKWVGTADDGVYLLNADCSKVLKHFNTTNACFPNNKVYSICWNSATQSVFIGFNGGLLEYKPENTDDCSMFFVEPTHITPENQGKVTIHNVPVNSTLYIKNAEGTTVKTIDVTSSITYWDCLDEENNHVNTGVYTFSVKPEGQEQIQENLAQIHIVK